MTVTIKKEYIYAVAGLLLGGVVSFLILQNSSTNKSTSNIEVGDSSFVHVDVSGAVVRPGVYKLDRPALYRDALDKASGFLNEADTVWISKNLNLSTEIHDNIKIYIPYYWDTVADLASVLDLEDSTTQTQDTSEKSEIEVANQLNINSASAQDLVGLKGIGESYAQKILDNMPYTDFDDFVARSGVPKATLEKLKDSLSF